MTDFTSTEHGSNLPDLSSHTDGSLSGLRQDLIRASGWIDDGRLADAKAYLIEIGHPQDVVMAQDARSLEQYITAEVQRVQQSASGILFTSPHSHRTLGRSTGDVTTER